MPAGPPQAGRSGSCLSVALADRMGVQETFALQGDVRHLLAADPEATVHVDLTQVLEVSMLSLNLLCGALRSLPGSARRQPVVMVSATGDLARTIASWDIPAVDVTQADLRRDRTPSTSAALSHGPDVRASWASDG